MYKIPTEGRCRGEGGAEEERGGGEVEPVVTRAMSSR